MPRTFNRAAMAVVQRRSHLGRARTSDVSRLSILSWLDDPEAPWLGDRRSGPSRSSPWEVLAQLEQVGQELLDAAGPDGSVLARGDGHGLGDPLGGGPAVCSGRGRWPGVELVNRRRVEEDPDPPVMFPPGVPRLRAR